MSKTKRPASSVVRREVTGISAEVNSRVFRECSRNWREKESVCPKAEKLVSFTAVMVHKQRGVHSKKLQLCTGGQGEVRESKKRSRSPPRPRIKPSQLRSVRGCGSLPLSFVVLEEFVVAFKFWKKFSLLSLVDTGFSLEVPAGLRSSRSYGCSGW